LIYKNYTKSYIRHLINTKEITGLRLSSFHNVYFMIKFIEKIRENIKNNTFEEFKRKIENDWKREME